VRSYDLACGCWGDGRCGVASSVSISLSVSDWMVWTGGAESMHAKISPMPSFYSSSTTNGDEGTNFFASSCQKIIAMWLSPMLSPCLFIINSTSTIETYKEHIYIYMNKWLPFVNKTHQYIH
jgi:hypothetical protein